MYCISSLFLSLARPFESPSAVHTVQSLFDSNRIRRYSSPGNATESQSSFLKCYIPIDRVFHADSESEEIACPFSGIKKLWTVKSAKLLFFVSISFAQKICWVVFGHDVEFFMLYKNQKSFL